MLDIQFQTLLQSALGDPAGALYALPLLESATARACVAYSRRFPFQRRMTTGNLTSQVVAGATTLYLVGGPFTIGQTIQVSPPGTGFGQTDTCVIAGMALQQFDKSQSIPTLVLTLAAPLLYSHPPGAFVTLPTPGLSIIAGQDTYALPYDFIAWNKQSFEIARGAKASIEKPIGFYDQAYTFSQLLSQVGPGGSANFAGTIIGYGGFAGNGLPIAGGLNANGLLPSWQQQTLVTLTGDSPKLMVFAPAPTQNFTLDCFYYGVQTLASIPYSDQDLLTLYAQYAAQTALADSVATQADNTVDDMKEEYAKQAATLRMQAADAFKMFEEKTKFRCFAAMG